MMIKEQMMKKNMKYHKRMKLFMMEKNKKRKRNEKNHKKVKMRTFQDLIQELHLEGYKRIILKHKS